MTTPLCCPTKSSQPVSNGNAIVDSVASAVQQAFDICQDELHMRALNTSWVHPREAS